MADGNRVPYRRRGRPRFPDDARDRKMKVRNRRDATINRNSRLGCSVEGARIYTGGLPEVIFKP